MDRQIRWVALRIQTFSQPLSLSIMFWIFMWRRDNLPWAATSSQPQHLSCQSYISQRKRWPELFGSHCWDPVVSNSQLVGCCCENEIHAKNAHTFMQDITIAIARYWKFFIPTTKRTPKSNLGHFQPTAITFESVKGHEVQKYRNFNQKIIFQTNHCPLLKDFVSNYKASSNN